MTSLDPSVLLGDALGFSALALIAVSSLLMLFRSRLLRMTKNIALLRRFHVAISTLAGLFLILHAAAFIGYQLTVGVLLGYAAAAVAVAVWVTGTAFVERLRDSLLFHGSLSFVLIVLIVVHAGSSSFDMPVILSEAAVALAVAYSLVKGVEYVARP